MVDTGFEGAFDEATGVYGGTQIIYDMSARVYHSDADGPRLSQSLATTCVNQTPLHAWQKHPLLGNHPYQYTASVDDGTIVHWLVLEPETPLVHEMTALNKEGETVTDFRTKAAQEERDAAIAAGKIPLLAEKLGAFRYKAKAIRSRLLDMGIEFTGRSEAVIYWSEETPSGPVKCRARLDHIIVTPEKITVVDLKTAQSAKPRELGNSAWRYGYDIQHAAYTRAVAAAFPDYVGRVDFVFAFGEIEKPYAVNPVRLNGEFRTLGEARWIRGRDLWAKCLTEDNWPGYEGGDLAPPGWAMSEEMGE